MNIDNILDNIYPLPEVSKQVLKEYITEVHFRKGYILLRTDRIEKNIIYKIFTQSHF